MKRKKKEASKIKTPRKTNPTFEPSMNIGSGRDGFVFTDNNGKPYFFDMNTGDAKPVKFQQPGE